jgi:prepilin-type N-terminal cleavage/methylation domain-containing protein
MKNNSKTAFSLIELSIVVLIIGILIAGVTQSSRVLGQTKLSTARTITQSSPVSSIKNLLLWIESTSEESLKDSETDDGLEITSWNDLNPQSSSKNNFIGTHNTAPIYQSGAINGLPAVYFAGADEFMSSENFSSITTGSATVFMVVKLPSTLENKPIFSKRPASSGSAPNIQVNTLSSPTAAWGYCDADGTSSCDYTSINPAVTAGTSYVLSITYASNSVSGDGTSTATGINFFQNGVASGYATTINSSPNANVTDPLFLGKDGTDAPEFFNGHIGELLIFDRTLKKEERQAIEVYLGRKWGITVTPDLY